MESKQWQFFADQLWQARQSGTPIAPLSESAPGISLGDAYEISKLNFARRIGQPGVRAIGKKIGLTSRAVQKQLGVEEPDFGYLTSDMEVRHQGEISARHLIQGRIEGEVAFVLKKSLLGTNTTASDVLAATDHVRACIEGIDSRVRDWKIRIQDTVADNASSAFFVLAPEKIQLGSIDLVAARMRLWVNGEQKSEGVGSACMESPLQAVAWLANAMGALGSPLLAGDIILSGAYGPVVPVKAGDDCAVEISGLGRVEFRVAD